MAIGAIRAALHVNSANALGRLDCLVQDRLIPLLRMSKFRGGEGREHDDRVDRVFLYRCDVTSVYVEGGVDFCPDVFYSRQAREVL